MRFTMSRPLANSAARRLQTLRSSSSCCALPNAPSSRNTIPQWQEVSHISGHEDSIIREREFKNVAIGATKSTTIANVDNIDGFEFSQTLRDAWRQLLIEQ
jgi:hypothetical protein